MYNQKAVCISLADDATVADLVQALYHAVQLPTSFQLIANGAEMKEHASLSALGEYFFNSHYIHIRELEDTACREWQRCGRCNLGQKCPLKGTHDMMRSPRYVAHQPSTTCADSSPTVDPPDSAHRQDLERGAPHSNTTHFAAPVLLSSSGASTDFPPPTPPSADFPPLARSDAGPLAPPGFEHINPLPRPMYHTNKHVLTGQATPFQGQLWQPNGTKWHQVAPTTHRSETSKVTKSRLWQRYTAAHASTEIAASA